MERQQAMKALEAHADAGRLPTGPAFKFEGERPAAPPTDMHAASNRTQELMFQLAAFREGRGLDPLPESATVWRRDGLKSATVAQKPESVEL